MNVLSVNNLSFQYQNDTPVIEGVSFSIPEKSTTILIGPNGSGKTTLLKMMIGLLNPTQGDISVFGKAPRQVRKRIGYVPQKLSFDQSFPITVFEFLNLERKPSRVEILNLLQKVDMKSYIGSSIGSLSGGQLQRVLIARSLLGSPDILFLDEPVSGIDIGGEQNFYDLIKSIQQEHNMTVIMVSHEVHVVSSIADNVICINKKMLCSGEPHLALKPDIIEQLYGDNVALYDHQCN